jgi:1-deoxy-D-xylulose-5-phosphate synthase
VFGDALAELAELDENIVAMTPAMPSGSSLWPMMNKFPDRSFDVGIAEQHAVTFAAGLAAQGKKAFCAIYSTFLQRGFDQLVHDVAIQKLPVVFCIDRAGVVGADGPTHHGAYDTSYMRSIPNLIISSPLNEQCLRDMMFTASKYNEAAWAIRYPRGAGTGMEMNGFNSIEIGKGICLQEGEDVAVLSFGPIGNYVTEASHQLEVEDIHIGHYDMRFAKPLDTELLDEICDNYPHIITIEDGARLGGFGSAVAEYIAEKIHKPTLKIMGLPDRVIEHGTQEELHAEVGIDVAAIVEEIKKSVVKV